jgi:hypothetical protein
MPFIRVRGKLFESFIIRRTYSPGILVTLPFVIVFLHLQIHNPCSIVLIILHGSIQGCNPEFYFTKIPVNTTDH